MDTQFDLESERTRRNTERRVNTIRQCNNMGKDPTADLQAQQSTYDGSKSFFDNTDRATVRPKYNANRGPRQNYGRRWNRYNGRGAYTNDQQNGGRWPRNNAGGWNR